MKEVSLIRIIATLLLINLGLWGCESIVAPEISGPDPLASSTNKKNKLTKFRFSHLLDIKPNQNKQQTTTLDGSFPDSTEADLIIGFIDHEVDPNKLLQRYSLITQFKLLQRYDGSIQYTYGMSVILENLDPTADFETVLFDLFNEWESDLDISWFEPDLDIEQELPGNNEGNGSTQVIPWGIQSVGYTQADVSNVELYIIDSEVPAADLNLAEVKYFVDDSLLTQQDLHGYYVAGAAAATDNTLGVVGVAPGVPVHSFVVADALGQIQLSTVVQALDEVISRKNASPATPMVVNISLGTDVQSSGYNSLDEVVEAATDAGIIVVVAAGNEGKNAATISPAHVTSAITVGAFDDTDAFAYFSNYGSGIDILAPGISVLTLSEDALDQLELVEVTGTSMAAPHVAGAAVAYLAQNPSATPAAVQTALTDNARPAIINAPPGTTNKAVSVAGW